MVMNEQICKELGGIKFNRRNIQYSNHAMMRIAEKSLKHIKSITVGRGTVKEYYPMEDKYVIRIKENMDYDLVLVLIDKRDYWFCVTVFRNHKDDNHSTLKLKHGV